MCSIGILSPHAELWMDLVYLKYWTLNLMPLVVYPKNLFPPNFSIKESITHQHHWMQKQWPVDALADTQQEACCLNMTRQP